MKELGLYREELEHDSCGIGFIANLKNAPSHSVVEMALDMLENMEHRGGCGCDPNTGDGAGIMLQIPHDFFKTECDKIGIELPEYGQYGLGVVFFPGDDDAREACRERFKKYANEIGFTVLGYRKVPVGKSEIGPSSIAVMPEIEHVFLKPIQSWDPDTIERKLFVLRNYATHRINEEVDTSSSEFHLPTLSYKMIAYKGMLTTYQLRTTYPDLHNEELSTAIALVHSRFSTNTFPKWKLAQPFRYIAHNGEINTVRGNVNNMKSREMMMKSTLFTEDEMDKIIPICNPANSDSANLDSLVEMLVLSGRSMPQVMMMLIPEAWQENTEMDPDKRAFYEYFASIMEPWDGPASICFTDGNTVGATLDRNGLRPSRYCVTKDGFVVMASEAGALPVDPENVEYKGRLQPGRMFVADLEQGRIISDEEIKSTICTQKPYGDWLIKNRHFLKDLPKSPDHESSPYTKEELKRRQHVAGYTTEDIRNVLAPMGAKATEPIGSMGADTPLAVLSHQAQHLANYFKQIFAQVSNPPIDPIREKLIMSLHTWLGSSEDILFETPEHCKQIRLEQPVLSNDDLAALKGIEHDDFKSFTLDCWFLADGQQGRLEDAINSICAKAEKAVHQGYNILILSDRAIESEKAPIPSLLITGALHHHLIDKRLRSKASIVVEASDVVETHHYATLIGYGASAVNPYLAIESLKDLNQTEGLSTGVSDAVAVENYKSAIGYGLRKILSKMGISTLQSYQNAQIFEALGIDETVIQKCFTGTMSRIGGLDFDDLAREAIIKHRKGFPKDKEVPKYLEVGGYYQWKRRGEYHLFNPETIHLLQRCTSKNNYDLYKKYADKINEQSKYACTLRGLFDFKDRKPIPLSEVEPKENILKRFATGAMSFGSISHEAHSTLAIAMNRIGGKSNSGEGGEDEIRFDKKPNGDWERSAIKQVASGRFGVTSYYLSNAVELQIKMAQGAKPGEGGQLPGHKVDEWIGRVRHSTPGVGLISPPPHHDIYSIEDLAQLIFDLKNANREARVNVKLVAEAGVGTIAAGVAKGFADVILISGHDGGTGASPLSSIRHAGVPWELGLSEAHQTLVRNDLRSRVTLQTDGQIRTGRDIAIAALLGAEEFGVSTAALVVEGCILMRKCHLNTCPVGIATQDPDLRKLFTGDPDHVVNFFNFLAEDLREIMASLGFRTINEMIGQSNLLKMRDDLQHWKLKKINLGPVLHKVKADDTVGLYNVKGQQHKIDSVLDWELVQNAMPALEEMKSVENRFRIVSTDRSVGGILSNEVSKRFKKQGLPDGTIHFKFKGSAGQSFGLFGAPGIKFELEGEANDYFGKGLSGAELIVYPPHEATYSAHENIIIGNVAFYGATSGTAYINGQAGERFCVRNSGVETVVEGIGDHGCEYMTGGRVVILGETGRNFAAGMSGGIAYIYDPSKKFKNNCNMELVEFEPLEPDDIEYLQNKILSHHQLTESAVAEAILDQWNESVGHFIKVMPREYKRALMRKKEEEKVSV